MFASAALPRQAGRARSRLARTSSGQSRSAKWIGPMSRRAGRVSSCSGVNEPVSTVTRPPRAAAWVSWSQVLRQVSQPSAATCPSSLAVSTRQRVSPVSDRRAQVVDDLVVVGLERVDYLEYQRHLARPGRLKGA